MAISRGAAPRVRRMAILPCLSNTTNTSDDTTLNAATAMMENNSIVTRSRDNWIAEYRLPWVIIQLVA